MDDRQAIETAMLENQAEMKKINRLFNVTYYICFVPSALFMLSAVIMTVSILITLGEAMLAYSYQAYLKVPVTIAGLVFYNFSREKEKRFTVYSAAALGLEVLLCAWEGNKLSAFIYIFCIIMQMLCFLKYDRIDYLKCQRGYPDFNPLLFYEASGIGRGRRISDSDVKKKLSSNREDSQSTYMEEIKIEDRD